MVALIADIVGIGTGLSKVIEIIDKLRFKWHVNGKELEQLKRDIEDISDKIVDVKKISGILGAYEKYYLNAYEIYSSSDKLREYIQNNFEDLSKQKNDKWFIIEDKLEEIKRTKTKNIKIILGGINFLDAYDAGQIELITSSLNENFYAADKLLLVKNIKELKALIKLLSDDALKLYNIYEDSINKMIAGLGDV